jgi:hypothetical protein
LLRESEPLRIEWIETGRLQRSRVAGAGKPPAGEEVAMFSMLEEPAQRGWKRRRDVPEGRHAG